MISIPAHGIYPGTKPPHKGGFLLIPERIPHSYTDPCISRNSVERSGNDCTRFDIHSAGHLIVDLQLCEKGQYEIIYRTVLTELVKVKQRLAERNIYSKDRLILKHPFIGGKNTRGEMKSGICVGFLIGVVA